MGSITCAVCGTGFLGRSDAVYCSPACRQKAHRNRTARRIDAMRARLRSGGLGATTRKPNVAASIQRAREQVHRSRELCRDSVERIQRAAAMQQQLGQGQARSVSAPGTIHTKTVRWPGN
jgi:hypothetical protein